jgi:hypothetical protein
VPSTLSEEKAEYYIATIQDGIGYIYRKTIGGIDQTDFRFLKIAKYKNGVFTNY